MSQKKILLVEDNEFNRKIVHDLLARQPYDLMEAHDGEAGVEAARREKPNLIIMDVQLPKLSGLDATRRIRAEPETAKTPSSSSPRSRSAATTRRPWRPAPRRTSPSRTARGSCWRPSASGWATREHRHKEAAAMTTTSRWIAVWAAVTAAAVLAAPTARAGQEEQFTPEYKEVRSAPDPKHTPKIVAPDAVKRGQWFDVTVSVGSASDHPSLAEHFVRYIALYINGAEISRAYLHPVFSFPKVTFTIALDEGGVLKAIEEPTHSAAWEASKPIKVTP